MGGTGWGGYHLAVVVTRGPRPQSVVTEVVVTGFCLLAWLSMLRSEAPGPALGIGLAMTLPLFVRRRYPFPAFAVVAGAALAQWAAGPPAAGGRPDGVDRALHGGGLGPTPSRDLDRRGRHDGWGGAGRVAVARRPRPPGSRRTPGGDPARGGPRQRCAAPVERTSPASRSGRSGSSASATRWPRSRSPRSGPASPGELHDVVAHSLSVMVAQADGASYVIETDPDRARRAMVTVADTGRDALSEMRRLLGVLRPDRRRRPTWPPQPGVDAIPALVDRVRGAGLPVELAGRWRHRDDARRAWSWRPTGSCRRRSRTRSSTAAPGASAQVSLRLQRRRARGARRGRRRRDPPARRGRARPRPRRHARAGGHVRRQPPVGPRRRRRVTRSSPPSRSTPRPHDHPRDARRRPGAAAGRLPHGAGRPADIEVVGEAEDGADAVRLLGDIAVDVVLMDVRMPGMDGVDATRRDLSPLARRASGADPDHLRPRRVRLRGPPGRGQRLPPEGRAPAGAGGCDPGHRVRRCRGRPDRSPGGCSTASSMPLPRRSPWPTRCSRR